jgi:cytochrome c oxidase subunit II
VRAPRLAAGALLLLGGCTRNPSVLFDHAGPHAASIGWLMWLFFAVTASVFVVVLGFLGFALWRGTRHAEIEPEPITLSPATESRLATFVAVGVGLTVIILTVLVGASYATDKRLISFESKPSLEIELTGHQWWWEIRYLNEHEPSKQFTTANELHLPVGKAVKLTLKSNDVIHSVWIPNLAGKRDIIPGRDNSLTIQADRDGVWHGRCAEFCGYQHAFMALTVVADAPERFESWQEAQRQSSVQPQSDEQKRGQEIFTTGPCALCHVIRGTEAAGHSSYAPELTHLKSRTTIGAGAAPNTKGHLGGWIIDPHGLKPGVHMPVNLQNAADFQALLAYLEILK